MNTSTIVAWSKDRVIVQAAQWSPADDNCLGRNRDLVVSEVTKQLQAELNEPHSIAAGWAVVDNDMSVEIRHTQYLTLTAENARARMDTARYGSLTGQPSREYLLTLLNEIDDWKRQIEQELTR